MSMGLIVQMIVLVEGAYLKANENTASSGAQCSDKLGTLSGRNEQE